MIPAPILRRRTVAPPLPPLCRPAAWACLWRALGSSAILSSKAPLCP